MKVHLQRLAFFIALVALFEYTTIAIPAFAQTTGTSTTQSAAIDPNLAGGPLGHGSKLDANDSVLIQAPVARDLPGNPAGQAVCYSIRNSTTDSFFVPWKTKDEWSSFLDAIGATTQLSNLLQITLGTAPPPAWIGNVAINRCCPPQELNDICGLSLSTPIDLGTRYEGSINGDATNWGAEGDVSQTFKAADLTGNQSINYQVTYVCKGGGWVWTHQEGSCTPTDGECAAGSSGLKALPADLTTLCAAGSVFGGLTNTGGAGGSGPWTWTCLGTPGKADASCTSGGAAGQCGTANGVTTNLPPSAGLCANGTTASSVTTSFSSPASFQWTCTGSDANATVANCSAPADVGQCNGGQNWSVPGIDGSWGTAAPRPTDVLCLSGTATAPTLQPDVQNDGQIAWVWQCLDSQGKCDPSTEDCICEKYDLNGPLTGTCGYTDGGIVASSTTPPAAAGLCDSSNSTLVSSPVYTAGPPPLWQWSCVGNNNGSVANCAALVDANPANCGPAAGSSYFGAPPGYLLCQAGTASTPNLGTHHWHWTCTDTVGLQAFCSSTDSSVGQCGDANGVGSVTPPIDLCSNGTPSAVLASNGTWAWSCTGGSGNAIGCSAPEITQTTINLCGSLNGSSSSSIPGGNLCSGGFATSVVDSGTGQWVWTCESGGNTSSCVAANTSTGPGVCGSANAAAVPEEPNLNLCSSGGPSAITGSGPWAWTCLGDGPNVGQNASCGANICQACSGSVTIPVSLPPTSTTIGGCAVQATSTWTETDVLSANNGNNLLQWSDPVNGTFSRLINAVSANGYCPPCYQSVQSVTNAQVIVQGAQGSCPGNGSINSGHQVTYNATNVTLTPH